MHLRRAMAVLGVAGMLVLAGCGGRGQDSGGEGDAASGPVTLKFWNGFTGPDRPAVEEIVKRFNDSQEQITIQMEIMPWDVFFQKLLPSLSSGTGPDIAAMDTAQVPQYAVKKALKPLDDYYTQPGTEADKLVPAAVEGATFEGVKYSVPMNFTTLLLYWNKDMFKEAGLDPEQPPANWQQFADYAKKLTKDTNGDGKPEQYGLAIADHATIAMWPILFWQGGGGVVSEDGKTATLGDPATIEAANYWVELVRNDKIAPIGLGGADADKLFQSKKAAMEIVGPWMTTGFKDAGIDFGLAMPPAGPKEDVTLGTSVGFTVSAKADQRKQQAAYEFFKFWNSKESQVYWSVNSGFPPNRTDIAASELSENPYVAAFGEPADKSRFYLANVQEFQKVNMTIFEPTLQRVLNGKATVAEAFPKADAEIQAVLDGS
jgi:ABC-type glycerol-3-phosphate transport system substrate-binding protein